MRPQRLPLLLVCIALAATVGSCSRLSFGKADEPQTYAVLLNGGGRPRINFQSHLTHVKGFAELLDAYDIPAENVVIFAADGADPEADLAVRESNQVEDFWILTRRAQQVLSPQIEYVDSSVEGFELHPATKAALEEWFVENGPRLRPDDTLFFYVTDHGEINKDDLTDNTIVLWKEDLSVSELRELLGHVPEGVRTVMLMSQCFSGSFAGLADPAREICGYFASTADRPAYGCYPENRGVDGVGHAHHFLRGIDKLGSLPAAQDYVLVFDDSPDVPHATSDVYLQRLLAKHAGDDEETATIDRYLAQAWDEKASWEPEIRLLDRIGRAYGVFSPRSLAELERQLETLPKVSKQLSTYADRWTAALDSVRQQNLTDFLEANPDWKERLEPEQLREIGAEGRSQLATELVAELGPFARADRPRFERMLTLRRRAEDAAAAAYRMEVRLGVLLRMRNQLSTIAGRAYLINDGTEQERAEYEALRSCEDLQLAYASGSSRLFETATDAADPPPFPGLADDRAVVDEVMPAWMGIRYRPPSEEEQEEEQRRAGAVTVVTVYEGSAAEKAGLRVGDVIVGTPDQEFLEPNQVREWTMQREIGEPAGLLIRRDGKPMRLTLLPDPFPIEMPKLPGPPKVGSVAPPVDVEDYRGSVEVQPGKETLLFFWATWCAPCKFALPEVMRAAEERGVEVIAITDEKEKALDAFFEKFAEPFPENIAVDPYRQSFQAYGVSGTPTFVLIDGSGKVSHYKTGYNAKLGLELPTAVGSADQ